MWRLCAESGAILLIAAVSGLVGSASGRSAPRPENSERTLARSRRDALLQPQRRRVVTNSIDE
jgi:hypothetical protein